VYVYSSVFLLRSVLMFYFNVCDYVLYYI